MAIAGKVAITLSTENGGAWSADVTYDRLVAVKHNNNLYISRKTVANVEPPNDEFWFLALEGFGGKDVEALIDRMNELSGLIQAIINGTTQVGNAKTLDGHEAEYFAPKEDLAKYLPLTGGTVDGNVTVATTGNVTRVVGLKNTVREINNLLYSGDGFYALRDMTNSKNILTSSADGTNTFNGTASGNIKYTDKPTGTYTGNGDATERTIATGGIGDVLFVNTSGGAFYIVSKYGAIVKGYEGLTFYGSAKVKFESGTLTITSDDIVLNGSSYRYTYQVL